MKNSFSLLELIAVIVIVSIMLGFILLNVKDSLNSSVKTRIKSEVTLIRNSIVRNKTKDVLLGEQYSLKLDNEVANIDKSELFKNILDFPLTSTTKELKVIGNWIKKSSTQYIIYLEDNLFLEFEYENNSFSCKSQITLCKEYE